MSAPSTDPSDLAAEIASARWYHCIELPDGQVTPGEYDLPAALRRIPFPASLSGKRCLDVGVRDGFWAFAMEQRGATDVIGIDLDDPRELDWPLPRPTLSSELIDDLAARARCFEIAKRVLGSKVERRSLSVYDLDPAEIGTFDFAFIGTLLLHLRDPVGALAAIRRVVTGELIINDVVSLPLSAAHPRKPVAQLVRLQAPFWWTPNTAALAGMIEAAGWEVIDKARRPYFVTYGPTGTRPPVWADERPLALLTTTVTLQKGMPHMWYRVRPKPDGD